MKIKPTASPGSDRKPWMTDEYVAYLQSDEWKRIRAEALERAGHRCEFRFGRDDCCGETEGLQVHHKRYGTFGFERPDDLQVLCRRHHRFMDIQRQHAARQTALRRKYGDWRPKR